MPSGVRRGAIALLLLTVYGDAMKEALEKRAQNIKITSPALHMHLTPEEDALLHSCVHIVNVY